MKDINIKVQVIEPDSFFGHRAELTRAYMAYAETVSQPGNITQMLSWMRDSKITWCPQFRTFIQVSG